MRFEPLAHLRRDRMLALRRRLGALDRSVCHPHARYLVDRVVHLESEVEEPNGHELALDGGGALVHLESTDADEEQQEVQKCYIDMFSYSLP